MAFESISNTKLNVALNTLDNINSDKLTKLKNGINNNYWSGYTRETIKTALGEIIKEYGEISKIVKSLKTVKDDIKSYNDLIDKNKQYQGYIDENNYRINNWYYKAEDEEKRNNCYNNISYYKGLISDNKEKMTTLKNKIDTALGG